MVVPPPTRLASTPAPLPAAARVTARNTAFQLALGEALKAAPNDAEREELLRGLRAVLDANRKT